MKIVFFDMDGPVCNRKSHACLSHCFGSVWREADPNAIGFMNRLYMVSPTNVRFVCASDWRENNTKNQMEEFLSDAGWIGRFHDDWATPLRDTPKRGHGYDIDAWLDNHTDVSAWVALDDSTLGYKNDPRLIKADLEDGLPLSEMKRAFELLHGRDIIRSARLWKRNYQRGNIG